MREVVHLDNPYVLRVCGLWGMVSNCRHRHGNRLILPGVRPHLSTAILTTSFLVHWTPRFRFGSPTISTSTPREVISCADRCGKLPDWCLIAPD